MQERKAAQAIFIIILAGIILTACQQATSTVPEATTAEVEEADPPSNIEVDPEEGPVTLNLYTTSAATLDPQAGEDVVALNNIESLFVNLTNYTVGTNEIEPEAATEWTISEDGLVYTFDIRTDIPWVNHDPESGETSQDVDEEGNPRFVTADDFEYSIKRLCNPNNATYYSSIIAPVIEGCEAALNLESPDDEEDLAAALDSIGVTALDDRTLKVTLAFPASYFLSMTPMWVMSASPRWAIEQYGNDQWFEPGKIVTNGRYVLHEWVPNTRRTLLRNPLMPADMAVKGNIEQIVTTVVPDVSTGYLMWLNNEVDVSAIPDQELAAHLEDFPDETARISDLVVFYLSFRSTKPPFDDPRVRRAFSAAFDRERFVTNIRQGQGEPMIHFAPPGIFGAPPIDEVGVGFDPEFARDQLAAAGYPDCEGLPLVTLTAYSGQDTSDWIEFAQNQWAENLGCSTDRIQIEQIPFNDLLAATDATIPDDEAPHMWTLGWGPDYPDENNWVGVLWCGNEGNRTKRACSEADDLIVQAREEDDQDRRVELYHRIEELFFGPEGEYPIAPIWVRSAYSAQHDWLSEAEPALFGGQQYYHWVIDQDAKLEARTG